MVDLIFDHLDFAVNDFEQSRSFYVAVLAPLDIKPVFEIEHDDGHRGTGFGIDDDPQFWIFKGTPVSGRFHFAFAARTRSAVDAFHEAAVSIGAESKGAPGLRPRYGEHYYAAYVFDPNGHTIEAVCRGEE